MKRLQPFLFVLRGAEPLTAKGTIQEGSRFVYDQEYRLNVVEDTGESRPIVGVMMDKSDTLSAALGLDVTTYMTEARGEGDRPD